VQTSFLGDVILTTPLIAELGAFGPVDVLTTPAGKSVLANNPLVRNTIVFDKKASGSVMNTWKIVRKLRESESSEYDVAIMAQGSMRSSLIAALAGIPERRGFDTSAGKSLYTQTVQYRPEKHHAERLLSLAGFESPAPERIQPKLFPGESERSAVNELLGDDTGDFVVLAPGSAWGTKRWPYFGELARLMSSTLSVVIVGGDTESRIAAEIRGAVPEKTIDATGMLSVLGSAELIRRARAIITNDSAPLHLASAMDTPTVAVFGPTVPEFGFGPLADARKVAGVKDLDCRPCDRHGPQRCPLGHWRCMRELSAEHVYELLRSIMPEPGMG
jgi:heptosyltransferase-2